MNARILPRTNLIHGGWGGGCKVITNLYSQVEFLDNWFRRHPLKNSNYFFSLEFCLAATFTNLFFVIIFPGHYSEKRFTGCSSEVRACLHEGGGPQPRSQGSRRENLGTRLGGPQEGEVTCGGLPHLTCKRDHIKMRHYMIRRVSPPKRATSPTWGPPHSYKRALNQLQKT